MKKILTVVAASLMSLTAFGQSTTSPSHMIDFDADTVLQGSLDFDSGKSRGQKKDNDTQLKLNLNYAYTLPMLRNLQLGGRLDYNKGTEAGRGDFEDYGADIGAIWNFGTGGMEPNLMNSFYASLFVGYGWANNYTSGTQDDEFFRSTAAIGKRFELTNWGISHLVYSPEVALQSINSKTGGSLEYSQNLQLRFLQFSVLF
jgi:hypothetical protein